MKFSVLIPTRNRLDLLKYAVETIIRQDYDDWELIISDNDSEEDVQAYIISLNDKRIKYYRTSSFVPVTENWNNAIDHSSGDYVLMLGDDDGLTKGYLRRINALIEMYKQPDLIYTDAYIYAYPGVMPGYPEGFLQRDKNPIFSSSAPTVLPTTQAVELVRQSVQLRMRFAYNMQFSVIKRHLIDVLRQKGAVFQSPYPDFYATNALFLKADTIVIYPQPVIIIGISPKSYGYFHFNKLEKQGKLMLKNIPDPESIENLRHVIMPGAENNTSWLLAMETLKANYGDEFDLHINYATYRFRQMVTVYNQYFLEKRLSDHDFQVFQSYMRPREKLLIGLLLAFVIRGIGCIPKQQRALIIQWWRKFTGFHTLQGSIQKSTGFQTILDVFEALDAENM